MRVRCRLHLRMSWITIRQSFAGDETIQESSPDTGRMSRDTTEDHFRCVVLPTTQSEWACTYRQLHTQIKIYVPPLHSAMLFFRTPSTTAVLRQRKIGINVFPSVHLSIYLTVWVFSFCLILESYLSIDQDFVCLNWSLIGYFRHVPRICNRLLGHCSPAICQWVVLCHTDIQNVLLWGRCGNEWRWSSLNQNLFPSIISNPLIDCPVFE